MEINDQFEQVKMMKLQFAMAIMKELLLRGENLDTVVETSFSLYEQLENRTVKHINDYFKAQPKAK